MELHYVNNNSVIMLHCVTELHYLNEIILHYISGIALCDLVELHYVI